MAKPKVPPEFASLMPPVSGLLQPTERRLALEKLVPAKARRRKSAGSPGTAGRLWPRPAGQGLGDEVPAGADDVLAVQFIGPDRAILKIDVQVLAHVDVTPEDMKSGSYSAPILPCSARLVATGQRGLGAPDKRWAPESGEHEGTRPLVSYTTLKASCEMPCRSAPALPGCPIGASRRTCSARGRAHRPGGSAGWCPRPACAPAAGSCRGNCRR